MLSGPSQSPSPRHPLAPPARLRLVFPACRELLRTLEPHSLVAVLKHHYHAMMSDARSISRLKGDSEHCALRSRLPLIFCGNSSNCSARGDQPQQKWCARVASLGRGSTFLEERNLQKTAQSIGR